VENEILIAVSCDADIVAARQKGRELAVQIGFSPADSAVIATAISELARNILRYAGHGQVTLTLVRSGNKQGIVVVAHDKGPGIDDIGRALQDGYSTSRGLGLGLPGVKRLMDEFEINSEVGHGTTVTVKKWRL
jgi:serine/threonine-protein kinase RsbT